MTKFSFLLIIDNKRDQWSFTSGLNMREKSLWPTFVNVNSFFEMHFQFIGCVYGDMSNKNPPGNLKCDGPI